MDIKRDEFFKDVLQKYGWNSSSLRIQTISKGLENQNYLVQAKNKKFVLRVYSISHSTTGVREKSDIEFELRYMEHLRDQGVPVALSYVNLDGSKITEVSYNGQPRFAALFEFVEGEEAGAYDHEKAVSLAETLLLLRKSSQTFAYNKVRKWPGNIVEVSLSFYAENQSRLTESMQILDALYEKCQAEYQQIQRSALPKGIVHGDIKLENVLFEGNQVKAVLDFDDYRESYLLEELTRTLMHDLHSPTKNVIRKGYFQEFYKVFEHAEDVSQFELKALEIFLQSRFIFDVTVYSLNGLQQLVQTLFADPNIGQVILKE